MDLSSPFGKLAHAMRHMQRLGDMQREYRESNPIEYSHFHNTDYGRSPILATQWRVRKFEPLEDTWSYVSGDAINNMRSALDHAMLLTAARFRTLSSKDERRVQYPIFTDGAKWEQWRQRNEYQLDEPTLDALEAVQPIDDGSGEERALALLNRLSNVDKHRRILTHTMSRPDVVVHVSPPMEVVFEKYANEPMREGLTLATVKFLRPQHSGTLDTHLDVEYYEVMSLDNGTMLPIALTMHVMFTAAFYAVAELLEPIANETDRWFVQQIEDNEKENLRKMLRSFMNEEAATAFEATADTV
ncbi:hypothetical protein [Agrococcus pavilionensis]|nr:hypothetical protein [Agrococcus pavilionensis]